MRFGGGSRVSDYSLDRLEYVGSPCATKNQDVEFHKVQTEALADEHICTVALFPDDIVSQEVEFSFSKEAM